MDPLLFDPLLNLAIDIQQIPAPTFSEGLRADYLYQRFQEEGLSDVTIDALGNVYARLAGRGLARPLVISAHSDTVFPTHTNLQVTRMAERIAGPGIGDNSLGLAGLFGLLWALRQRGHPLPGDLWLVANVCEEGLGNLKGMRAVVDRFGDRPLAYIVLEGMALGQVYHRGLGVRRYRIEVRTPGGHSWVDHGQPSAVHLLAQLLSRLVELPLPSQPRTTLNAGVIGGGTSVNSIAAYAQLELDLRSEGNRELAQLARQVEALAAEFQQGAVKVTAQVIGERPVGQIDPEHPLVRLALTCLEAVGIRPVLNIGSTDANLPLSRSLPAICLGLTTGSGAHTTGEFIDIQPLALGLEQVRMVVEGCFQSL